MTKQEILIAEALRVKLNSERILLNYYEANQEPLAPASAAYRKESRDKSFGRVQGVSEAAREVADALQRTRHGFDPDHFMAVVFREKDLPKERGKSCLAQRK